MQRSIPFLFMAMLVAGTAMARPVHLFLAGDSTMALKGPAPGNPERGWGEALPYFFDGSIVVDNRALNGRSSLSFRTEGHWDKLLQDLQPEDFVLIQFGHNDQKSYDPTRYAMARTDYRTNLEQFVSDVRENDAYPILATSIVRRKFNAEGDLRDTHGEYPEVVRELATELDIPLLDLESRTRKLVQELGEHKSRRLYLWPSAGKYARFPDGNRDDTHLSLLGASLVAGMAIEELRNMKTPLADHLNDNEDDFLSVHWIELAPKDMNDTEVELYEDERVSNVRNPSLGVFRSTLGKAPRPAVVVCPGGGYARLSIVKEGREVAEWFNSLGIDAYVLKYRLKEFGYPAPLLDTTRAIRYLRANADALGIDPERIGILGFSAGGHAAGMATTLYDSPDAKAGDPLDNISARPDFAVLAYPVATMLDPFVHEGSRRNLLGENPTPAMMEKASLERQVDENTPPVFLFHTADDAAVPVENSLQIATAMSAHERSVAVHVTASAPHGIGMRPGFGASSKWPIVLAGWLVDQEIIEKD
ncbi:MAG: GDSL-type esterase/lipase family protein [Puniceicoccaceae bacterium]